MIIRLNSKWHKLVVIMALSLLLPVIARSDPPKGYSFHDYDEGLRLAKASGKKIFLYYGRYGCGYCDKTNKESFSDPEVTKIYKKNYILVYVDAEGAKRLTLPSGEQISEQQFGARLKSLVTPYFMVLLPDGTPISRVPGFKTIDDLLSLHVFIEKKLYKKMTFANFNTD